MKKFLFVLAVGLSLLATQSFATSSNKETATKDEISSTLNSSEFLFDYYKTVPEYALYNNISSIMSHCKNLDIYTHKHDKTLHVEWGIYYYPIKNNPHQVYEGHDVRKYKYCIHINSFSPVTLFFNL
ncbi:MAG: hypothetical protein IIX19_03745 [Alistipes sp.]|nr:hypothetical protein [Alistipes sp.]